MKYLSLNNDEYKELLRLKRHQLPFYLIVILLMTLATYLISIKFIFIEDVLVSIVLTFLVLNLCLLFIYTKNRSYLHDLQKRKKRVYVGLVANKKIKDSKYLINVDGNLFIVNDDVYHNLNIGDRVEIHTSEKSKHLFKVLKLDNQ
ncbi:MAG: hypothetical protein NZ529_07640 [Cytophagaceae bacterium]|nr:hypothetical protein [Cytophagaceae bacterium]MDW8456657.1 hypothetical protein [Cytophagaceae bacterium]